MAADLSVRLGGPSGADLARVTRLLEEAGLPLKPPAGMTREQFLEHMAVDKKVDDGRIRLVLLESLGSAYLSDSYPADKLDETLAEMCR